MSNRFFEVCLTIVFVAIFSTATYIFLENYLFHKQLNIIFDKKNITIEKKMLDRNDKLFLDGYITEEQHTSFETKIISKIKSKTEQITNVCQNVYDNAKFKILKKLDKNLSAINVLYTVKYIFLSLMTSAEQITNLISSFSGNNNSDDNPILTIDEKIVSHKLKNLLFVFKNDVLQLYSSSFFFSIFKFFNFSPFFLFE